MPRKAVQRPRPAAAAGAARTPTRSPYSSPLSARWAIRQARSEGNGIVPVKPGRGLRRRLPFAEGTALRCQQPFDFAPPQDAQPQRIASRITHPLDVRPQVKVGKTRDALLPRGLPYAGPPKLRFPLLAIRLRREHPCRPDIAAGSPKQVGRDGLDRERPADDRRHEVLGGGPRWAVYQHQQLVGFEERRVIEPGVNRKILRQPGEPVVRVGAPGFHVAGGRQFDEEVLEDRQTQAWRIKRRT